jgi:DNA-binding NarL/FixJ family response regulator
MMTADVNTIAICDTEPIAIEGFRSLMEASSDLRLVAEEASLMDGSEAVRALAPKVLIVDKAFGSHAVMDWVRNIREYKCETRVIIWGVNITEAESLRFLQAGASGVIRKSAALGSLLHCLRTVACGSTWMECAQMQEDRLSRTGRSPLTAREVQVMELVERGLKNKDIGMALGIRTGTVKIHLKHIFEKTGVRGRYGLALTGLKEKGLLSITAVETL